jgi:ornithine cyclodeaminase/alanine dehydrogenase-like protein (mu-crystallin family)
MDTLIVRPADLRRLTEIVGRDGIMDEMTAALTKALTAASATKPDLRPRDGFHYDRPHPGVLEWMPHMPPGGHPTIKVVGYNPSNPTLGSLPTIVSTVSQFDHATGHLEAVIDGIFLTALRTGAASAIASRILAKPNSSVIGLIGCGAQAVTQLHALSRIFPLHTALIFDIDPRASESLKRRASFIPIDIRIARLQEIETDCDIICTATTVAPGCGPVLPGDALQGHVHINAVGADLPNKTELPLRVLRASVVCPDFLPQALVEGECQQLSREDVGPDLIDLVGRPSDFTPLRDRKTVFDSTGFALEDNVAASLILRWAAEYDLGAFISIEHSPSDPLNPYDFSAFEGRSETFSGRFVANEAAGLCLKEGSHL